MVNSFSFILLEKKRNIGGIGMIVKFNKITKEKVKSKNIDFYKIVKSALRIYT